MKSECKFTTEGDIWSYGILLFEIASLGEKPYGSNEDQKSVCERLVKEYKQGIHEYNVIYEDREKNKIIRNLGQLGIDRTMVEEHIFGTLQTKKAL